MVSSLATSIAEVCSDAHNKAAAAGRKPPVRFGPYEMADPAVTIGAHNLRIERTWPFSSCNVRLQMKRRWFLETACCRWRAGNAAHPPC